MVPDFFIVAMRKSTVPGVREGLASAAGHGHVVDGQNADITAGAGTMGCEILEQLPESDAVCIPIGDSSLFRGVAFAAKHRKPQVRIIGVQPEGAPVYYRSWKEGRAVASGPAETIADGLAVHVAS
jgi:threonine dehydratase